MSDSCEIIISGLVRKAKSYFNNFGVVVVKHGCDLLGLGTLKSAVSRESVDEMS